MKIEKAQVKGLAYYEALPYTIIVRKDDDGDFVGRIQELPGCIAHGESEASAIASLRSMQRLWLEDALSAGDAIPEPENETELPSGKWVQRVPRRLHRDLTELARRDNVSLNQLVTSLLSEAVTAKSCTHAFESYIARMSALAVHRNTLPANMFYVWHGDHGYALDLNEWNTSSHKLKGSFSRGLDLVAEIMAPAGPSSKKSTGSYLDNYLEDVFAGHR